jgi:DNA-binding XRE family transcriptional regulator
VTAAQFKAARAKLGLTQQALAQNLGMTINAIYKMEAGDRPVTKVTALAMRYLKLKKGVVEEQAVPTAGSGCSHERIYVRGSASSPYQYCENCGAVRVLNRSTGEYDDWHSCDNCRLGRPAQPAPSASDYFDR